MTSPIEPVFMITLVGFSAIWWKAAPMIAGLISVVIFTALGIFAVRSRNTNTATNAEAVNRTLHCVALFVLLWSIVPSYRAVFDDFELDLPSMTVSLFQLSDLFRVHIFKSVLLLSFLLVGDVIGFRTLHHDESTRTLARIASALITFSAIFVALSITAALLLPLTSLINSLAG